MAGSSDITYAAAENHLFEIQSNSSSELLSSVPTLASFSLLIELLDSLGFSRYCLTQVCFSIPAWKQNCGGAQISDISMTMNIFQTVDT